MATDTAVTYHAIEQIQQLAAGAVLWRCLHAAANLGIADALNDDPQTAATLAAAGTVLLSVVPLTEALADRPARDGQNARHMPQCPAAESGR